MANQNKTEQEKQGTEQNQQTEQQNVEQKTEQQTEQKAGFGAWCKRHWKGLVAGVTGALAVGGSAVVAYKKGKAAGIMSVPVPEQEDYSLNPNE